MRPASRGRPEVAALDSLVRQIVLERDGYRCRRCGGHDKLQAAHVYPKGSHPAMRHVPANVLTLCQACHLFWWHRHPMAAAEWVRANLGDLADQLRVMSQRIHHKADRTLTRIYLEKVLEAMHANGGGVRC